MILTLSHLTAANRMLVYSVHEPPNPLPDRLERAERLVFVKDGFSWGAFVFGPLWLIANRLWLALLAYLGITGGTVAGLEAMGAAEQWGGLVVLVIHLGLAFEADVLQRWSLARRGWHQLGTVSGQSQLDCERRFFDGWLARQPVLAKPSGSTAEPTGLSPISAAVASRGPDSRRWRLFGRKA